MHAKYNIGNNKIDNHSFYNYMAFVFDSNEGHRLEYTQMENALT